MGTWNLARRFATKVVVRMIAALLVVSAVPVHGLEGGGSKKKRVVAGDKKLTPAQSALIDKAIVREREVIRVVRERAPMVETYIQNMKPDAVLGQVPESDEHFLGRVEFGRMVSESAYESPARSAGRSGKGSLLKSSIGFLGTLGGSLHLRYRGAEFVQMLFIDSNNFDKEHYSFYFVRNDFLGNTPTAVFDVTPSGGKSDRGRFFGRIWVETRDGNIVRFNGDFAASDKEYGGLDHFDSWRTNVQPELWLPTSFYVEESDPKSAASALRLKAINHVWGYRLRTPRQEAENTSIEVVGATDLSKDAADLSPLSAARAWTNQAEDNVIDRLYQAGLLDAPSDFDKTLEALANNILAYNNVEMSRPVHVRTLLTEPLESLSVGNTIILSKSLIDTTAVVTPDGAQQMGNLNALLAFQLAHIISGHRVDTKYAFNDRLQFPDTSAFVRVPMHHTDAENAAAAKKAIELLNAKELVDGQKYFGLYLRQLQQRVSALRSLNEPLIGDGLVKSDTDATFWMGELMAKADKLDVNSLHQQAAEHLSAFLRFDPWTDQILTVHNAIEPILSASDKMPFEVAPLYPKLAYYSSPGAEGGSPGAAPAALSLGDNTSTTVVGEGEPAAAAPAADSHVGIEKAHAPIPPKKPETPGVESGRPGAVPVPPPTADTPKVPN